MQKRRDTEKKGYKKGGIRERMDAGQEAEWMHTTVYIEDI